MSLRKIIIGLGNPGDRYQRTPHNLGFEVADRLAVEGGVNWRYHGCQALIASSIIAAQEVILVKPQTFMNLSGRSVVALLDCFQAAASALIVVCDDLALPFGKIRIRPRGSSGGHKGLESIIEFLGEEEFIRIRLGIKPEADVEDAAEYVLRPIPAELKGIAEQMVLQGKEAVKAVCAEGLQVAMNQFN